MLTGERIAFVTAECVTSALSLLANGLVLLAIRRTRALRTVTNCFIGSLAAADALVAIVIPITLVTPRDAMSHDFHACVYLHSCVALITNTSQLNLVAIALER